MPPPRRLGTGEHTFSRIRYFHEVVLKLIHKRTERAGVEARAELLTDPRP